MPIGVMADHPCLLGGKRAAGAFQRRSPLLDGPRFPAHTADQRGELP